MRDPRDVPSGFRLAVMQRWLEHESGWGMRPDGWSLHADAEQWREYLAARARAPEGDEYDRPEGAAFEVRLREDDWARIAALDHGVRAFGRREVPDVGDAVDVPDDGQDAAAYLDRLRELYGG